MYGSTGGNASTDAAQKTDIMVAALVCELEEVAKDQVCIIGDLNADLEDIPMALDLVENEGWKDMGANAENWGGVKDEPTCMAPNSKKATRRDYILVNQKMFQNVQAFQVEHTDSFATHQPIMAKVRMGDLSITKKVIEKPSGAYKPL